MTWSSGAVSFTQSPNRRSGFTLAKGSEEEEEEMVGEEDVSPAATAATG